MEGSRVKIGAVGPNESFNFGIHSYLPKKSGIFQGAEQFPFKHAREINLLQGAIRKRHPHLMRARDLDSRDSMNGMIHGHGFIAAVEW